MSRQRQGNDLRRREVLRQLAADGVVQVADLARRLGVSGMTVRRDLGDLAAEGLVRRIHGGAMLLDTEGATVLETDEPEFDLRLRREAQAKEAIADCAFALLGPARTIAVDVGTNTYLFGKRLFGCKHLRVFTNSLRVAELLADAGPEVYIAGGRVRPQEQAVGGDTAVAQFGDLWFDVSVVGVSGVTAEGLFDFSVEDAPLKRIYLARSTRRIVLCDASKFAHMSLVRIAGLDRISDFVTDAEPPQEIAGALADAGVRVHIASRSSPVG